MALGLCACGGEKEKATFGEEEARTYVEGLMKASYLGQSDPGYLELVDGTEDDVEQIFHNNLHLESQFFQWLWEIEFPDDDFEEKVEDLFKDIYSHIQWQVTAVEKGEEDAFSVTLEIRPLNIINLVFDALTSGGMNEFLEKYPYEVQMAMDDEEYQAMDKEFAQLILDVYQKQMPYIGYTETKTVTVQLVKDEDGYYYMKDEDLTKINDLVIDYSRYIEPEPETTPTPTPEGTTTPEPTATPSNEPSATPAPTATPSPTPAPTPAGEDLHHVEIEVKDYGTISVELDASAAPKTVENFLKLAGDGFYDGLTFHRIMSGFMIQGGDPQGNGYGGSDETIYGEFAENGWDNPISHTRGVISMARSSDPDSASSQFFIVHRDSTFLDGQYAAFGHVTDGMTVVDAICADAKPIDNNGGIAAADQPIITSIKVID